MEMNDDWIKPEGTIIGDFQKERTDAMMEMFNNERADGIFPTTQLYRRLDNALKCALDRQRKEILADMPIIRY
jgi:hypothetical protein